MAKTDWSVQVDGLFYRIQHQDRSALKAFYQLSASKLLGLLKRILNNHHEAEEALQDVFVKIWQNSRQYTGSGSAWGWVCVMARNTAIDRLRSSKSRQHSSSDEYPELLDQLTDHIDPSNDHWIGRCLSSLKPKTQQAIVLCYVNGYSHSELCDEMAAPLGTVKAWVRRGLQELKQCLAA